MCVTGQSVMVLPYSLQVGETHLLSQKQQQFSWAWEGGSDTDDAGDSAEEVGDDVE